MPCLLMNIIRIPVGHLHPGHLHMRSGTRQGCPSSGTQFALALGPLIRCYLTRPAFALTHILCYADDTAIVAHNIFRVLPHVARALRVWRLASWLARHGCKCSIIPAWGPPHTDVLDLSSRYLGVDVGPHSDDTQWLEVNDKMPQRARDIRSTTAAFPTNIAAG